LISPFDRGFLYADGVFETLRVYGGKPFRLADHWSRMTASARFLGFDAPVIDPELLISKLVKANQASSASIRITLTRGMKPAGPRPGDCSATKPTLFIQLRDLRPGLAATAENGAAGKRLAHPLRAKGIPFFAHKTLCYLPNILALGEAGNGVEPIIENTDGHVAEGATSNIFWIKDGALYTPAIEAGCLAGVTRKIALALARADGVRVSEGFFPARNLLEADEVFITNSVIEIAPLVSLDGQSIAGGKPGPLTRRLQTAYVNLVKKETV